VGILENNIKLGLDRIGCGQASFCVLAGISETRFSRALRNVQPFGGGELQHLMSILQQMTGLVEDARPYPLSFKDPQIIKSLLFHRRAGLRLVPVPVGPAEAIVDFESEFEATKQ